MDTIKHILTCLDLTEIDKHLIDYSRLTASIFNVPRVTFVHAIQTYDLPGKSSKSFPEIKDSLDSMIRDEIDSRIDKNFGKNVTVGIEIKIAQEDAAEDILICIEELEADLILVGQKYGEDRQKRYGKKLSAESSCDIMFIPEDPPLEISKVLCAIDYSASSKAAFDRALHLHQNLESELICYYIQDTSKSYFPASTSISASQNLSRAETKHQQFMETFSLDPEKYPCRVNAAEELISEGEKLYQTAEEEKADLIIVGATGDTATETSLLGNVAETLRRMEKTIPVMIVTDRENKRFFSQLLS